VSHHRVGEPSDMNGEECGISQWVFWRGRLRQLGGYVTHRRPVIASRDALPTLVIRPDLGRMRTVVTVEGTGTANPGLSWERLGRTPRVLAF
jgi:hypothetical protein